MTKISAQKPTGRGRGSSRSASSGVFYALVEEALSKSTPGPGPPTSYGQLNQPSHGQPGDVSKGGSCTYGSTQGSMLLRMLQGTSAPPPPPPPPPTSTQQQQQQQTSTHELRSDQLNRTFCQLPPPPTPPSKPPHPKSPQKQVQVLPPPPPPQQQQQQQENQQENQQQQRQEQPSTCPLDSSQHAFTKQQYNSQYLLSIAIPALRQSAVNQMKSHKSHNGATGGGGGYGGGGKRHKRGKGRAKCLQADQGAALANRSLGPGPNTKKKKSRRRVLNLGGGTGGVGSSQGLTPQRTQPPSSPPRSYFDALCPSPKLGSETAPKASNPLSPVIASPNDWPALSPSGTPSKGGSQHPHAPGKTSFNDSSKQPQVPHKPLLGEDWKQTQVPDEPLLNEEAKPSRGANESMQPAYQSAASDFTFTVLPARFPARHQGSKPATATTSKIAPKSQPGTALETDTPASTSKPPNCPWIKAPASSDCDSTTALGTPNTTPRQKGHPALPHSTGQALQKSNPNTSTASTASTTSTTSTPLGGEPRKRQSSWIPVWSPGANAFVKTEAPPLPDTPNTPSQPSGQGTATPNTPSKPSGQGTATPSTSSQPSGQGTATPNTPSQPSGQGTATPSTSSQPSGQGTATPNTSSQACSQGTATPDGPPGHIHPGATPPPLPTYTPPPISPGGAPGRTPPMALPYTPKASTLDQTPPPLPTYTPPPIPPSGDLGTTPQLLPTYTPERTPPAPPTYTPPPMPPHGSLGTMPPPLPTYTPPPIPNPLDISPYPSGVPGSSVAVQRDTQPTSHAGAPQSADQTCQPVPATSATSHLAGHIADLANRIRHLGTDADSTQHNNSSHSSHNLTSHTNGGNSHPQPNAQYYWNGHSYPSTSIPANRSYSTQHLYPPTSVAYSNHSAYHPVAPTFSTQSLYPAIYSTHSSQSSYPPAALAFSTQSLYPAPTCSGSVAAPRPPFPGPSVNRSDTAPLSDQNHLGQGAAVSGGNEMLGKWGAGPPKPPPVGTPADAPIPSSTTSTATRTHPRKRYLAFDTNVLLEGLPLVRKWVAAADRGDSYGQHGDGANDNEESTKMLVPLAVTRELDGLKRNPMKGHMAREAVQYLERMQQRRVQPDGRASTKLLLRFQLDEEVASSSVRHATDMVSALMDQLRWNKNERSRVIAQVAREVRKGSRGDDCILEAVQYFNAQPDTQAVLVTEDRMLRLRALQAGLHALSCWELDSLLMRGMTWPWQLQ